MARRHLPLGFPLVLLSLSSCGSGVSRSSCGLAPCGGNVVGTWKLVDECPSKPSVCADAKTTISPGRESVSTLILGADSLYVDRVMSSSRTVVVTFPSSCLTPPQQTCADRDANARTLSTQLPQIFAAASCSMDGSSCACTTSLAPIDMVTEGTYRVNGTQISFKKSNTDEVPSVRDFCVDGDTLHLFIDGDEQVLVKQ